MVERHRSWAEENSGYAVEAPRKKRGEARKKIPEDGHGYGMVFDVPSDLVQRNGGR